MMNRGGVLIIRSIYALLILIGRRVADNCMSQAHSVLRPTKSSAASECAMWYPYPRPLQVLEATFPSRISLPFISRNTVLTRANVHPA